MSLKFYQNSKNLRYTSYTTVNNVPIHKVWAKLNSHFLTLITFLGLTHKDASEGPMLLIDIIDKEFVPYSIDNYIADRDSLAELLFSFIWENILSAMYVDWDLLHLSLLGPVSI